MFPYSQPTHAGCAGWLHALFPVMVFAEKSKYTEARQKLHPLHHHKLLYIIGSYGLGRKPISPLCTRPFRQVTTACTCPSCPLNTLSMQLQAIHYSSLVISCLSLHPQQQIFPRSSSYQLLRPTALSGCTSIQAGEHFVYKSVLQVTSSNLRIQHTYLLLQAIVCRLPYSVLCLLATLQVWQVRTSRTPAITHSNRYGDRKVHA